MRGQWPKRKFPVSNWAVVAAATGAAMAMLGGPKVSFENGFEVNFANVVFFAALVVFFIAVIAAVRRFTPFLTLPRHHQEDEATRKNRTPS